MIEPLPSDPKVSVPIRCGEYMDASGFFVEMNGHHWLVTAKHLLLPTDINIPNPAGTGVVCRVNSDYLFKTVDVFLDDNHQRIELDEAVCTVDVDGDIIAILLPFDPREYGFAPFDSSDITIPCEETETLTIFGYASQCFPENSSQHHLTDLGDKIDPPVAVEFHNMLYEMDNFYHGMFGFGIDAKPAADLEYNGLSGAPVLGDGLVGVHSGTARANVPIPELDGALTMNFFGAKLIEFLLQDEP